GIAATFHFQALHHSSYFRSQHDGRPLPNAERFTDCLLRLPLFAGLGSERAAWVAEQVLEFYR
ncbi:MAG: DegT/DnrJ/EryC1/StrS family aminotransferase, partial [Leptospiraceae bacterium]|nr:DegT/DnrJ/EryC1/StrS family aminotransferase [Leptospiraceae bacterium]